MLLFLRRLASAGSLFLTLIAAGCGSDASPAGPSGSQGARTATIVGRVINATASSNATSSSASVQASSSRDGIRVTVVGTSISATTDASGHFTLAEVPTGDGSVTLLFEGHGIHATLQISGLTPGQTLEISVQLLGDDAFLDVDDDVEVEIQGRVESLNGSSLVVAGRTVRVDASTRIKRGDATVTLAALGVGTRVEVDGLLQPDGSILATKIKVDEDEVEIKGSVESLGASSLVVAGRTVRVDSFTRIEQHDSAISLAALTVGTRVEVDGFLQPDGAILATKIKVEDDD